MEKYSAREVIEQAIRTEKLGYEFYTTMAKKFRKDFALKDLFELLASKELRHEKIFSKLKTKVENEEPEGWEDVAQYLRAIVESEFFLGKGKSLPSLRNVKTIGDAVEFAIGFEKETMLYFYVIKDVIKEKDIVENIIEEEKTHIVWLSEFRTELKKKQIQRGSSK
ncbi:MAG: ferritin family protein [Nitrospirae bacterium]|nr:ferritin family protein [Nitrospirota bacterium]